MRKPFAVLISGLTALTLTGTLAEASGLDRDTFLTDAPAVPAVGTVRVTGAGVATEKSDSSSSSFTGTVGWTPIANLSGDVGAYFQSGAQGPAARIRYQLLNQASHGLDVATGVRFKTVGLHPDQGEVEFILAAGRRFGQFDLVLNGVFGMETGAENGKDIEVKAFAGWRFTETLRAGIDSRLQAEISDEAQPGDRPRLRSDCGPCDLLAGDSHHPSPGAARNGAAEKE